MRKKITTISASVTGFFTLSVGKVFAQTIVPNPVKLQTLAEVIDYFTRIIRPVVLIVFLAVIMLGGWNYLTDGGDGKKIGKAKTMIIAGIVGFIIIALAPVIVELVGGLLGVQGGLLDTTNFGNTTN